MIPELNVFGYPLATYGLLTMAGLYLGSLLFILVGRRRGLRPSQTLLIAATAALTGLLGARLLFLLTLLPRALNQAVPLARLPAIPGQVFYGGLFLALPAVWLMSRRLGLSFYAVSDSLVPGLLLGQAIGRLGCLAAGCCYGRPCAWGLVFPEQGEAPAGLPLFPTQPLESAFLLLLLALSLLPRLRQTPGKATRLYLFGYGSLRFLIEFGRGDEIRGHLFLLSTSQWLSLVLLLAGFWLWRHGKKGDDLPADLARRPGKHYTESKRNRGGKERE